MAKSKVDRPVILSTDEARSGVTGHNVRYVLAFGMAGSLIAFIAIVIYFGYGRLTQTLAGIFAVPGTLTEQLLLYIVVPLSLAAVGTVLLLGLWNMAWGRSASTSQNLMRWRVALQLVTLCLVMAALFLSVK